MTEHFYLIYNLNYTKHTKQNNAQEQRKLFTNLQIILKKNMYNLYITNYNST